MKMSKKKIAIISIVTVLIIAGVVFAYLYFCTDMFKPTQELFYEYVGKAATTEGNYSYQDMLDDLKTSQTRSYTSKSTIGIELNDKSGSLSSVKSQAAFDILKNVKFNLETKANPQDKKASYSLGVEYGNNKITGLNLVKANDLYGIKSDLLDEKYIALENNNLKEFVKKLGGDASTIPNKIEEIDLYDLLYISKENQDKIKNTYKNVIKDSIPSSNYTKLDNVKKTINGQEQNVNGYSLKISAQDLTNVLNNFVNTAKDDDTTLDLLVEKINKIIDTPLVKQSLETYQEMANRRPVNSILGNSSSIYAKQKEVTIPKITKESLKQLLEQLTNQLKASTSLNANMNNAQVLEFVVYESNRKTVRIEMNLVGQTMMAVDFYEENGNNHAVLYIPQATSSSFYSYTPSISLVKLMDIEYNVKRSGNEKKAYMGMTLFNGNTQVAKISFDTTLNGKVGEGVNNSTTKLSIDTAQIGININMDSQIEYTDNVEIEEINSSNATILNNMSKAEIEAYFKKIETNLQKAVSNMSAPSSILNTTTAPTSTTPTTTEPTKIPDVQNPFDNINKSEDIEKQLEETQKQLDQIKQMYGI